MRAQYLGIYFSLMVHGMAAVLLFGISQRLSPAVKTVVLDFSLDSGGRMGEGGAGKGDLLWGDEARPQENTPAPKVLPGGRTIESTMDQESPLLSSVSEPPPLIAVKQSPILAEPPSLPETRPVDENPSPVHQVSRDEIPEILQRTLLPKHVRPKSLLRKKTVQPVPEQKTKLETPVQTAKKTPAFAGVDSRPEKKQKSSSQPIQKPVENSHSPVIVPGAGPDTGPDRFTESRTNSGKELPGGLSEIPGSGSQVGPIDKSAVSGDTLRGDGGSAYLKSNLNFIRGRLREHLCYPSIARKRGWSGEVLVSFTIYPDGSVDNIEIHKSCGISLLDKSALKTVQNACPFPNLPMAARIVIPIVYQLN